VRLEGLDDVLVGPFHGHDLAGVPQIGVQDQWLQSPDAWHRGADQTRPNAPSISVAPVVLTSRRLSCRSSRFRTALALIGTLAFLTATPFDTLSRGEGHASNHTARSYSSGTSNRTATNGNRKSIKCDSCPQGSHIKRDPNAVQKFNGPIRSRQDVGIARCGTCRPTEQRRKR
jgi:hypothetical protein